MTTARVPPQAADADRLARVHADPERGGYAAFWAALGLVGLAVAAEVWGRWAFSGTQLRPAPVLGPDSYSAARLAGLRATEVISGGVFAAIVWLAVLRPVIRRRPLGPSAMIAVACLVGSVTDGMLDMYKYIFAWNAHSVNLGSWAAFMPLHPPGGQTRYAEALIWGIPMYMYFCAGVAIAGCALVGRLRARFPAISNLSALAVVFAAACAFDFIVENAIIRSTQAYAFARAPASLTLWAGQPYQFPVYEMLAVASLGVIFTGLRLSALDAPDGRTFIERGAERFPPPLRTPVRLLAHIGFAMAVLVTVYHLPVNWLGTNGDSVARLASYMLPG